MLDPVVVMNLFFDVIILTLAIHVYKGRRTTLVLWIVVAFCLFAASYVLTILGLGSSLVLLPLRAFGYLSIIAGLVVHSRH